MPKPSYSTLEMIRLINIADSKDELALINEVLKIEKERYSYSDLIKILKHSTYTFSLFT